jgi:hypothetical protein
MDKKPSDRRIKTVKLVKEAEESADRILAAKKLLDEEPVAVPKRIKRV